jgi:hypothetical protein
MSPMPTTSLETRNVTRKRGNATHEKKRTTLDTKLTSDPCAEPCRCTVGTASPAAHLARSRNRNDYTGRTHGHLPPARWRARSVRDRERVENAVRWHASKTRARPARRLSLESSPSICVREYEAARTRRERVFVCLSSNLSNTSTFSNDVTRCEI